MFKEIDSYPVNRPGIFIEDELEAMSWSVDDLAQSSGIEVCDINDILSGERTITLDIAKGLGEGFGLSSEFFINMQRSYDRDQAIRNAAIVRLEVQGDMAC